VHKVTITGTVTPADAQVVVNGQPAKVTGSSFTGTLYVSAANQKIVVSAVAHGYVASQASTTVTYSPNVARQLVAAAASVNNPPASASPASPKVTTSVLTQAFGLSVASVAKRGHTTAGSGANTTGPAPTSSTGGSGASTPSGTPPSPTGSSPTTTPPSSSPAPAPAPTPAEIAAAIQKAWVNGCIRVRAGGSVVAYCTCTYNHLAGQLQTRASAEHVLKEMVPYLRSGDFRSVPAFIRRAVDACASKLPPLDPVTGKAVLSTLPGAAHSAAPASNPVSQSDPSATPVAPTPVAPTPVAAVPNIRSAFQQFNSTLTPNRPAAATPADARSVGTTNRATSAARLTPQSGHQGLREARIVAKALSYALMWVGNHNGPGPYPQWYRVQRRLHNRLAAALKLAA
jgi:hypothetical protein